MKLRTLVNSLGSKMKIHGVIFPNGICDFVPRKNGLEINASMENSTEFAPILTSLLTSPEIKDKKIKKYEVDAEVQWKLNGFLQEKDFVKNITIRGWYYGLNVEKMHDAHAELNGRVLRIWTSGNHNALLPEITKRIKPQLAKIQIKMQDKERWKNYGGIKGLRIVRAIEKKEKSTLFELVNPSEEEKVVEVMILISELSKIEKSGIPVEIFELIKLFPFKREIPPTLKEIAKIINDFTNAAPHYTPPKMRINGNIKTDAAHASKISFPQRATLSSLHIKRKGLFENDILLQFGEKTNLRIYIETLSPDLLPLQERVCDGIGIRFS